MSNENNSIVDLYDIENTVAVINSEKPTKVALQFPDSLLSEADKITTALKERVSTNTEFYILGDTTVCPCCIDTVAIEHIKADLVVHYGDACMSKVKDIPVYYAFEHAEFDSSSCVEAIRERLSGTNKTVYLGYDLSLYYCIHSLYDELKTFIPNLLLGEVKKSQNLSISEVFEDGYCKMGYHYFKTTSIDPEGVVLFIGRDGINYQNYYETPNAYSMLVNAGINQAFVYVDYELKTINLNKFLMQRYVQIERFENLDMIGVVVGTLSIHRYRDMISHITSLAETHDQTVYTFMVGKLNVPKLANFPGIQGFILIGCERSCFIDTREYPFPIITPYEYEISIGEHSWDAIYMNDYTQLLGDEVEEEVKEVKEEREEHYDGQIIAFESRILDYINEQHYHGLEQKGEVDTPAILKKGQSGIPSCYENELFYHCLFNK